MTKDLAASINAGGRSGGAPCFTWKDALNGASKDFAPKGMSVFAKFSGQLNTSIAILVMQAESIAPVACRINCDRKIADKSDCVNRFRDQK